MEIHSDEWLAELERLSGESADGMSSEEVAGVMGCSVKTALTRLRKLLRAGRVAIGYRVEPNMIGRVCRVPVYRLVKNGGEQ